jgi:plastocyanin
MTGVCAAAFLCAVATLSAAARAQEEPARSTGRSRTTASSDTGSLAGAIQLGPKLSSRKMRFHLYSDAPVEASKPRPGYEEEMQNVVVYLESAETMRAEAPDTAPVNTAPGMAPVNNAPRPAPFQVIRQENLAFVPHVLPILKGSSVEFPNSDPIFHNVFSLSQAASFDLGRYPKGATKSVRFDDPGTIKVFCHVHSDMSAVIMVLDNPYYVTPDAKGRYRIDGIPPGEYRAIGWHERARPVRRMVRIEPGATTLRDFSIPLAEAADGG